MKLEDAHVSGRALVGSKNGGYRQGKPEVAVGAAPRVLPLDAFVAAYHRDNTGAIVSLAFGMFRLEDRSRLVGRTGALWWCAATDPKGRWVAETCGGSQRCMRHSLSEEM